MMRGYSLPIVLLLMVVLAAAGVAAVVVTKASASTTSTVINRRQAFYACDGVGRAAMVRAREYMRHDATPTTPELQTAVCGGTPGCPDKDDYAPAGFSVDTLDLATPGLQACTSNGQCASKNCSGGFCVPVMPLPNGPFRGMNARQTDVRITIEATKTVTGARCRVEEGVTLGEIGLFQFMFFAHGYTDLGIPPPMTINGRIHVNGDFCAWAAPGNLKVDTVTASSRILSGDNCPRYASGGGAGQNYSILDAATAGTSNTYRVIGDTNDATCTTCTPGPGTGAWAQYSTTRWNGNAQDASHGVPDLRLPVIGTAAVQDGQDVSGNRVDNSTSLKLLLDPLRPGDNASIRAQRYANKADIVIINGIWFIREDGVPWPGTAVWSDHPGNYVPSCMSDEGAALCAAGWTPRDVGQAALYPGAKPSRYSYYRYGATGELQPDFAQRPIVSYGAVRRTAANDFRPAYWNGASLDEANNLTRILQGTRTGFRDYRVDAGIGGTAEADRIQPMNVNLAALAAALQDTDPGELGALLPHFNGIIYITNTWPSWDDNFDATSGTQPVPPLWPEVDDPGAVATPGLDAPPSARANTRLPYNLCKSSGGVNLANTGFGAGNGFGGALPAPACNHASLTRPNAVRIINGATINPTAFPNGLSIASDQGVYILGDLNSASANYTGGTPLIVPVETTSPFATWRPLMIGGDAVTLLSNNWNDANADWTDPRDNANRANRVPTTTMWAFASISGSVETSMTRSSGGLNNFPRFLEAWSGSGAETRILGSFVVGFRSVKQWQRFPQPFTDSTMSDQFAYTAPVRRWVYDTNFNLPSNQPPGTPSFFVQAIKTWKRE